MRLIDHLRHLGLDNKTARTALQNGKVFLMGVPTADGGREVDPAQVLYDPAAHRMTPGRDPAVIYQDSHLAVVWKPSGLLSVPATGRHEPNVLQLVGRWLGSCLAVHRLDEETSGLMLVARTPSAQERIKAMLENHTIERRYIAIVRGKVSLELRRVRNFLLRDRGDGKRGVLRQAPELPIPEDAKEAISEIQGLEVFKNGISRVAVRLHTGRTHQVRIHLAAQGNPILGDDLYGDRSVARSFPRVALHAAVLGFVHPLSGKTLRFESPMADDMEGFCRDQKR